VATTITSRATPVTLVLRADMDWLLQAARGGTRPAEPEAGATRDVLDALAGRGALFVTEISREAGRLPAEVETALWDAVARGLVTADGFSAVRALLANRVAAQRPSPHQLRRRGLRRGATGRTAGEGRWSLLPPAAPVEDGDLLAEAVAEQLLARWGVVFRDVLAREQLALPWRDVLWALRRMEARGTARGGRFVTGFSGEQYALPEAVDELRAVRRAERCGEVVRINATDPLNLAGIITPGPRVPAVRTNTVVFCDGVPALPDQERRPHVAAAVAVNI
jgi:ATP-dependent Lhr-like helicase